MNHGDRIVIGGGPLAGKTTLALQVGGPVRHTDELIEDHSWSEQSEIVASWMLEPGPWVIEGVATVRALRKALNLTPDPPCDVVIWLREPQADRTPDQASMAKGCETILAEIIEELRARGVRVEER